jgi:hypothetical protein
LIFGLFLDDYVDDFEVVVRITSCGVGVDDYKLRNSRYTECSPVFEPIKQVYKIDFSMSGIPGISKDPPPGFEVTFVVSDSNF